jgi:hypothetical protein
MVAWQEIFVNQIRKKKLTRNPGEGEYQKRLVFYRLYPVLWIPKKMRHKTKYQPGQAEQGQKDRCMFPAG